MIYTPVIKSTGERITIYNPIFSDGFSNSSRQANALYGTVEDVDTGRKYKIYGKKCGLDCTCDAYAVEIKEERKLHGEMAEYEEVLQQSIAFESSKDLTGEWTEEYRTGYVDGLKRAHELLRD